MTFLRNPLTTNFIFDEQEALLANPFVRAGTGGYPNLPWLDAFRRDFWGLSIDRSIGSYRPLPDLLWRVLWRLGARDQSPFAHHTANVLLHAANAWLVARLVHRRTADGRAARVAGWVFLLAAISTEAVASVVGLSDVLSVTFGLLSVSALGLGSGFRYPAVFAALMLALFSKESALALVPLLPLAVALETSRARPPRRANVWLTAIVSTAAFALYVELRRRLFSGHNAYAPSPDATTLFGRLHGGALRWFAQPAFPQDPINNPLVTANPGARVAGALRVLFRGFTQFLCPMRLSGDYSAAQEPVPARLVTFESVGGALVLLLPLAVGLSLVAKKRPTGLGLTTALFLFWFPVTIFPVSNLPVLLPTVRAERFWYLPLASLSALFALGACRLLYTRGRYVRVALSSVIAAWFAFNVTKARIHTNDYKDDLAFWDATREASPSSAKAHLNYSVMQGARGNADERLRSNTRALEIAPDWPMANVYMGDTLCRAHEVDRALPFYKSGFLLGPNESGLIALGLQCLWDEKALEEGSDFSAELETLAADHPNTWLAYLARDTLQNGQRWGGVDPEHRPRGYNEGPKRD